MYTSNNNDRRVQVCDRRAIITFRCLPETDDITIVAHENEVVEMSKLFKRSVDTVLGFEIFEIFYLGGGTTFSRARQSLNNFELTRFKMVNIFISHNESTTIFL